MKDASTKSARSLFKHGKYRGRRAPKKSGGKPPHSKWVLRSILRNLMVAAVCAAFAWTLGAEYPRASAQGRERVTWKPVTFAIVRYNEDAPKSWNLYHSGKRGVLLLRLWKRYLLVNVPEHEVYDIDPQKVKVSGDSAEFSEANIPDAPIETTEWKERDAGPVQRIRFRFGEKGNFLEIQIPLKADGKPAY